jgi:uncharacterized DUF497 family protein
MAELEFEWDEAKHTTNLAKHGNGFVAAQYVFKDAFAIERLEERRCPHDFSARREPRRETPIS